MTPQDRTDPPPEGERLDAAGSGRDVPPTDRTGAPSDCAAHAHRDSEALLIIGAFLAILAVTVLFGAFWQEPGKAMVVNIAAGVLLLLVGAGGIAAGVRLRRRDAGDGQRAT